MRLRRRGVRHPGLPLRGRSGRFTGDDEDRATFLRTLGEACGKTDWQVHAWCLMGNHFHLVLETPQANLMAGMRWLLGTFTVHADDAAVNRGDPTARHARRSNRSR